MQIRFWSLDNPTRPYFGLFDGLFFVFTAKNSHYLSDCALLQSCAAIPSTNLTRFHYRALGDFAFPNLVENHKQNGQEDSE